MALVNRDKDYSEQRDIWTWSTNAVSGVSLAPGLFIAPCAAQIIACAVSATGVSASPIMGLQVTRFVPGAGLTVIPVNGTSLLPILTIGTSGVANMVLPAPGATLVQLLRGDVVQAVTSGAASAATYVVEVVTQTLQDIKTTYGV